MEDLYEVLGLKRDATISDIKQAYRRLVKQYHPDSTFGKDNPGTAAERFQQIQKAYKTLSDEESRRAYDSAGFSPIEQWEQAGSHKQRAVGFYKRGRETYKSGNYEKAINMFHTAVNLAPENPLYCSWLGVSLSTQKDRLHDARLWCERAVKLAPYNSDYLVNLALVYKEAGLRAMTIRYLKEAMRWNPKNRRAVKWLDELAEETETGDKGEGLVRGLKKIFGIFRK